MKTWTGNYDKNTIQWRKGDIVIHDADAKSPKMLMKVIGYTRDGLVKTQYVNRELKRTIWKNEIGNLHSPEIFDIYPDWGNYSQHYLKKLINAWDSVRIWNHNYDIGQLVETTSADGGFATTTTTKAHVGKSGGAWIGLKGHGAWALEFVKAITGSEG
jgi:hypothetical protein